MKNKKPRLLGLGIVAAVWLLLAAAVWCKPTGSVSDTERRKLAQFPEASMDAVLSGDFMSDFESYALDQFPLRDTFRRLKSVFHYYVLRQGDNNGIYIADGYAAQLEYPLDERSVVNAAERFGAVYEAWLANTDSAIYACVVPDKGYYLAAENGYPAMDYEAMFAMAEEALPWADFIDITDCLGIESYYRTDTHWRQEKLLDAAEKICEAMGADAPREESFTQKAVDRAFYGVYYGQAALPMEPETLYILESDLLNMCTVYNHETGKTTGIYDTEKLESRDLYDIYLSGAVPVLTVENPNGEKGRELTVFRDSFGSSMIPLLLASYEKVTVLDTRYIAPELLGEYVDFHGQDVLFLYSTLVLNHSASLK